MKTDKQINRIIKNKYGDTTRLPQGSYVVYEESYGEIRIVWEDSLKKSFLNEIENINVGFGTKPTPIKNNFGNINIYGKDVMLKEKLVGLTHDTKQSIFNKLEHNPSLVFEKLDPNKIHIKHVGAQFDWIISVGHVRSNNRALMFKLKFNDDYGNGGPQDYIFLFY